jgi:hypothetical protein
LDLLEKHLLLGLARKAFTSWVGFFLGLWEMLLRRMGQMAGPFGAPFRDAATAIEGWREALKKAGDEMLMQAHAASTAGAETLSFNNAAVVAAASTGALAFKFGSLTNAMNQMGAEAKRTKDLFKETIFELEDYTVGLGTLRDEFGNLMNQVIPVTAGIGDLDQHFVSWNEVAGAATRVMGDVGNILSIFGVEVDSTIGKMTRLISSFMSLAESIGGVLGMFRGGGIGGGGLLGGLVGTGAAGGGSGLFGAIGGLLTNPLTAIIGGGLGVGVLVAKLFGKEANIAETVENTFGVELSKGLENTLANLATQTGDLSTAAALGISEIFNEALQSGQADLDLFAERIGDTFSFLERGQIDTTQAQDVLNKAIEQLLPHLDELGSSSCYRTWTSSARQVKRNSNGYLERLSDSVSRLLILML